MNIKGRTVRAVAVYARAGAELASCPPLS